MNSSVINMSSDGSGVPQYMRMLCKFNAQVSIIEKEVIKMNNMECLDET